MCGEKCTVHSAAEVVDVGEWNYLYIGLNCALCIWHDMVIYSVSFLLFHEVCRAGIISISHV